MRSLHTAVPEAKPAPDWSNLLAPPEQPDEIGRLGGYRVLKVLGSGGMGVVFLAEDPRLRRPVALKVMKPDSARSETRRRFLREAQAAAAVRNDHVVTIYQVGEDRGVPFLAMEFLQGESMEEWLKRGKRPTVAQLLRLGKDIARGLAAAHEKGLIHRDVKPGNLWLEAPTGRVKILDFGLARPVGDAVQLTQSGIIIGTPHYMSPEQAQCLTTDHRSDLFSLGCVLYHLATGRLPFTGKTTVAVLTSVVTAEPPPLRALNPGLPELVVELLERLLEKDPAKRPAFAADVVRQLQTIEREMRQTTPPATPSQPAAVPRRRRRWPPSVVAAAVVLALVGGGWLAGQIIINIFDKNGNRVGTATVPEGGTFTTERVKPAKPGSFPPLDPEWVKWVAAMGPDEQVKAVAEELKKRNPDFTGKATPTLRDGHVTELLLIVTGVRDLTPVRALPRLKRLDCAGAGQDAPALDLGPLKGLPLEELFLNRCGVEDLTPLEGMSLGRFGLVRTRVTDLKPLKKGTLGYLMLSNSGVKDITPLKGQPLKQLFLIDTFEDLSALEGMPLVSLEFVPMKGLNVEFLRTVETLTSINDQKPEDFWKDYDAKFGSPK